MRALIGIGATTGQATGAVERGPGKMRNSAIPFLPSSELSLVMRVLVRPAGKDIRLSREEQTFAHRAPALKSAGSTGDFLSSKSNQFPIETNS
jgi:hypothetical protein